MIGNTHEYERMARVEHKLWWYNILHEKVLNTIASYKITANDLIVDIGCGTGGLMQKLLARGYRVKGIDLSETAIHFCQKKGLDVTLLNIVDLHKDYLPECPKIALLNDSLCYFSEQEIKRILGNAHNYLCDNGLMIVNHPALKAFRGIHDISVGIQKRRNKRELEKLLKDNGFQIEHSEYWPFLLSPLIFLARSIQMLKLRIQKNVSITSDVDLPSSFINKLFYYITKTEQILPYKAFGSSLFIVARKQKNE
jgi:SAM-dependent methyltransferase